MGKEKISPEVPELKKYLQKLYTNLDLRMGARKTGMTNEYFKKIINNEVLPEFSLLKEVVLYADGDMERVKKMALKNPQMAYKYWGDFFPEAQPISKIGLIISEIIEEKQINRRDLRKEIGIAQSYLSSLENCKLTISYTMMCKFAHYFKIEPIEMIFRLLSATDYVELRDKFRNIIKKAREKNGWDIEEASARLKISTSKLSKIEDGVSKITESNLCSFVGTYKLDYNEMLVLCYKGRILNKLLPDINDYFVSSKAGELKKISEMSLEKHLFDLCKYKYISYGEENNKKKIETHTLITLLFLVLSNDMSKEKYHNQICYYLNNLEKKGNIANSLISEFSNDLDELGMGKFYEKCRKIYKFSYQELEVFSGFSRSYITAKINTGEFNNCKTCDRLLPLVGIPVCVGYESICEKISLELSDIEKHNDISVASIIEEMKTSLIWTFWRENIPIKVLKEFFDIVFNKELDTFTKYNMFKSLDIPEKYPNC